MVAALLFVSTRRGKRGIVGRAYLKGGKFAVFRLDEPIEPHQIPFAKVRKHIRRQVKLKHARRAFEVYIDSLRKVYAGKIKWFDEHLAGLNAGNTR